MVDAGWVRAAFEQALIGMALVDLDGNWLEVNRSFPALLGYTEEELRTRPFPTFLHPDDRAAQQAVLGQLRDSGGDAVPLELRCVHKDGRALWLLYSVALVRDERGAPAYFITQAQDITARKLAEQARAVTQAQLARSNLALQEFASVAAHDLQEPLRKIQAFGDRLQLRHAEALGPTGSDYLERMQSAAARMQRLINDLLVLARVSATTQPVVAVDLAVIAQEIVRDLEGRLAQTGGRIEIGTLPVIEADPTQMRQLLQNLLGNGLKFHRPGQPPVVKLWSTVRLNDEGDGEVCELTVADAGIGFDEQYRERIFGVFQRLHGRGEFEGTGIGLAICRTIAEWHGGTIVAASVPGEGTTFTVVLPLRQPIGALSNAR